MKTRTTRNIGATPSLSIGNVKVNGGAHSVTAGHCTGRVKGTFVLVATVEKV